MLSVKKIVITGPESSGKSTLSQQLAAHYCTQWVPEFARSYLEQLDRPYRQEDLLEIARGQAAMEDRKKLEASQYLFCDTGLEVIKIWSLFKYGTVDQRIEDLLANRSYDFFLLCKPDLEWTPDPLRETPNSEDRWRLFELYRQEIEELDVPFAEIGGQESRRLQLAIAAVHEQFVVRT
ncbi:AAA family ATPase [Flavilitoribacter nigricans]|uniref:ATPase n=1 Tax=Flavilitoribacter nigricans (strain ATCC 23147 / DSM 23189 / NBRC 102662 / NCIMB 1420 / SS-2) TaxID=1122177 RepID=A0A2D0N2Q8_FLAN2|nr:ATP-binding protein [Flavilitoribacter nigricans]PHN02023.1 ATPase [Flavilitoribacter nigricans DSM 23189 = NBRC 102662]